MVPVESMMTMASGSESRTLRTSSEVSMRRPGGEWLPEDCTGRCPAQPGRRDGSRADGKFHPRQQLREQFDLFLLLGEHRGELLGAQGVHLLVQRHDLDLRLQV